MPWIFLIPTSSSKEFNSFKHSFSIVSVSVTVDSSNISEVWNIWAVSGVSFSLNLSFDSSKQFSFIESSVLLFFMKNAEECFPNMYHLRLKNIDD